MVMLPCTDIAEISSPQGDGHRAAAVIRAAVVLIDRYGDADQCGLFCYCFLVHPSRRKLQITNACQLAAIDCLREFYFI
jgi:hypothetical protein